jgi:hypothetical protein
MNKSNSLKRCEIADPADREEVAMDLAHHLVVRVEIVMALRVKVGVLNVPPNNVTIASGKQVFNTNID